MRPRETGALYPYPFILNSHENLFDPPALSIYVIGLFSGPSIRLSHWRHRQYRVLSVGSAKDLERGSYEGADAEQKAPKRP